MAKQDAKGNQGKKGTTSKEAAPFSVPGAEPLENEQHERFVQELMMFKPQVQAYLKVYPESTYAAARANSSRLITDDSVKNRVAFLKEERQQRCRMTADDIHERLVMASNFDPSDLLDDKGALIPLRKLPPEIRLCIESVERKKDGSIKVETISKTQALQMLGRHQKMFTDKVEHSVKVTLEELVGGEE